MATSEELGKVKAEGAGLAPEKMASGNMLTEREDEVVSKSPPRQKVSKKRSSEEVEVTVEATPSPSKKAKQTPEEVGKVEAEGAAPEKMASGNMSMERKKEVVSKSPPRQKVSKKRSSEDQTEEVTDEATASPAKKAKQRASKTMTLDKAIDELEQATIDCDIKPGKHLPKEVALKLEQVAKLAGSRSWSDEIVAKLMRSMALFSLHPESLKGMLRRMVSSEEHKQGDLVRIKEELGVMVSQWGDKSSWNAEMENKLYEYYMVYLQGAQGERRGGLSRKFYMDVAEMWPAGAMDKEGVKEAISRAKKRDKKNAK